MISGQPAGGFQTLIADHQGGALWLTLNRPDHFNAMNPAMMAELRSLFDALREDNEIRVVVLRGAGKHFCAGLDLDNLDAFTSSPATAVQSQRAAAEVILAM